MLQPVSTSGEDKLSRLSLEHLSQNCHYRSNVPNVFEMFLDVSVMLNHKTPLIWQSSIFQRHHLEANVAEQWLHIWIYDNELAWTICHMTFFPFQPMKQYSGYGHENVHHVVNLVSLQISNIWSYSLHTFPWCLQTFVSANQEFELI